MLRAQAVYAPDAPSIWSEGDIALGRRLFRTLPQDAYDRGPEVGASGRWALVADVRLDNRDDLCDALGIGGGKAALWADSAIVLKAFERWEDQAIERLVGDFAIAAWDAERQRLLLARDFMGARPLHYHSADNFFAFASMPKGLHALAEVPTGPDEDRMTAFLALLPEAGTQSFFHRVERVPAGHLSIIKPRSITTAKHWRYSPTVLRLKSSNDYAEALRESFDRAVAAQLRGADQRVAVHLSGGLDSSAVAGTAARLLAPNGRVDAFTAAPREGFYDRPQRGRFGDEARHAAAVAALYPNMEHVLLRGRGKSPLASLDRNFFLYERPVLNLCNGVWSDDIMNEAKHRGHRVLLTGQAGNMSFSFTGLHLLPELMARGRMLKLARTAIQLRRGGTTLESIAAHAIGPFLPARVWRTINLLRGRRLGISNHSAINPDRMADLHVLAASHGLDMSYRPRRDAVASRLWALGRMDMGNFNKGHLGGWGIEVRDPTADRRLVELCLSIPNEQYLRDGRQRALARTAFVDRLPPEVINETRKGYQAADWWEGVDAAMGEAREEVLRFAPTPGAAHAIDTDRMSAWIEEWPAEHAKASADESRYRLALLRGISSGHFLRKATGSN